MATAKEMARKWGCSESTVRNYCASGIIPPAEKSGVPRKWAIPDDWPKPPMGRHGLCFLLDTIHQLNSGVKYESIKWGYKPSEIQVAYAYLISAAFMSTIDTNRLSAELHKSMVTPRGAELIERENREGKSSTKFRANFKVSGDVGIASFEVGGEMSNARD
ncbi:helix-turn-helix domain-containing protein [Collinsella tanakaei]|uniref:helix-turn-helix domain-containing protein n=1 Tax=Collinsella tanakaei TaxID=626935 RepID=UPI002E1CF2C0